MKYLILLLPMMSTLPAYAADECGSVWVYQAYKTCASPAHGVDLSQPGEDQPAQTAKSGWLGGGQDQAAVCSQVEAKFNRDHAREGLHGDLAKPTPVSEDSDRGIQQSYRYGCTLNVKKYPFKSANLPDCGAEDKVSYQVGGSSAGLAGAAVTCLSCENLKDAPPKAMVECLRQNVEKIVDTKAIDLRDTDLTAISNEMTKVLKLSTQVPIENLKTVDQIQFFADFIQKHPAQTEPSTK